MTTWEWLAVTLLVGLLFGELSRIRAETKNLREAVAALRSSAEGCKEAPK